MAHNSVLDVFKGFVAWITVLRCDTWPNYDTRYHWSVYL